MVPQYSVMIPTLVRKPFHRDGWVYEEKVDGYRMLAYKDGARVRLVSRNGVDHTRRYPDVAAAVARLKHARTRRRVGGVRRPAPVPVRVASRPGRVGGRHAAGPHRVRRAVPDGPRYQPTATARAQGAPRRGRRRRGLHLPGAATCT